MLPFSPALSQSTDRSPGPNNGIWSRIKKKVDWEPPAIMSKARYLTLVHGEMETIRMLPNTLHEAEEVAREWVRPGPDDKFGMRIPVDYASFQASRLVQGPYLWLSNDETYQIAINGVPGTRIEIMSDVAPPPALPPPPPPPPVLEMPAAFNLELSPGQMVALDTTCASDDLDMSRTEDGTLVDGNFWGCLKIVHDGDNHQMDFKGTRLVDQAIPSDFWFDSRTLNKLIVATRPTTAKCHLHIMSPVQQYCDVTLKLAPMWRLGMTWPPAEMHADNNAKFFLRAHPSGALEHFEAQAVVTSLYYEAMPDTSQMDPASYISPANGFAMSIEQFIPHLSKILTDLGMSIPMRTQFVSNAIAAFSYHKNIAYRFMPPHRLSAAIDVSITADPCIWTRIFLMWRGVGDDEMEHFASAGEKEASLKDWKSHINYLEASSDSELFRALETSIMECA